jgi:hypothetical protein
MKRMVLSRRQWMLAAALAGTIVAVVWAQSMDLSVPDSGVAQVRARPSERSDAGPAGDLAVGRVAALREKDPSASASGNAFAPKSFYVPPPRPKAVAPPPPPPPTAPALPFRFMGILKESETSTLVFLSRDDRLYSVRAGDVLDGTYRVDNISQDAVTFVYLPMNETQKLRITDPS